MHNDSDFSFKPGRFLSGIFFTLTGIIIIAGFIFLLRSCVSEYDENFLKGKVQLYSFNGRDYVAGLHQFRKCTGYDSEGGLTSISMHDYFFLQIRDAGTGKLIGETEINEAEKKQAEILGGKNANIWLWVNNKFMVYNIASHELINGNPKLEEVNSFLKNNLPDEKQYAMFDEYDKTLHITAKNGIYYAIDCMTLNAFEEKNEKRSDDQKRNEINQLYKTGYQGNEIELCVIIKDKIYAVLSETETGNSYLNNKTSIQYDVKRRKFYESAAKSSDLQIAFTSVDKWNAPENANVFLNGGFLVDPADLSAIKLENPYGFLILHKKQIDDKSPILISRVDLNGALIWTAELPVSKINNLMLAGGHLTILSNDGVKIYDAQGTNIYLVLQTGKFNQIDLFSQTSNSIRNYLF